MKRILGGLVVAAVLVAAGVASACDWCYGHGGSDGGNSSATMRQFHKETLGLRDDLAARQIELAEEYDKDNADAARIAAIRKEIVDLESKIQVAADKSGVRPKGSGRGHARMAGCSDRCGCW